MMENIQKEIANFVVKEGRDPSHILVNPKFNSKLKAEFNAPAGVKTIYGLNILVVNSPLEIQVALICKPSIS